MTTPRVIATLFFIVLLISLIIESYPKVAAASAAAPGLLAGRHSEYTYSSACKARGEYTETRVSPDGRAVTEGFEMKAGAVAPAILSTIRGVYSGSRG
ncbi:hypothetical protein D3C71_1734820 [compost metagenome]